MSKSFSEVPSVLARHHWVNGVVPLATCNRLELYLEVESEEDVAATASIVYSMLATKTELPEKRVREFFDILRTEDVPRHLFSVSAGLESAVVGEREVAGQVRRALSEAQSAKVASKQLTTLFQIASRTAKEVGKNTSLGERGRSIVSVGLDLTDNIIGGDDWAARTALIIGTGAYAGTTVAQLHERGCHRISVYSSSGRAEEFAAKRGLRALSAQSLDEALAEADMVIGCSGGDFQIDAERLNRVRHTDAPLSIIDLALTHDFAPDVALVPGVDLMTLESIRMAAPEEQSTAVHEASLIVQEASKQFAQRTTVREIDSAIVALRQHTMTVLDTEMAKVRAQHGCTAASEEVEFALRRMMRQFLHVPTVRARELAAQGRGQEYVDALQTLFGLDVEGAQTPVADEPIDGPLATVTDLPA